MFIFTRFTQITKESTLRTPFKLMTTLVAAAALALVGCSSNAGGGSASTPDGEKPLKVIAFTSGNQTPIGAWWVRAVTKQAEELGWDLTMIQGDFDFQKMNAAVEGAIGRGADVVLDGHTDVASIGSIVTAAKEAGIPIFAMDSATEDSDAFAINLASDSQQVADSTVDAIQKDLGGLAGKTVMVIGHDPHPGIRLRTDMAAKAITSAGGKLAGGEIQKVTSPATGRTEALTLVADYLAAHPGGLDAVWVGWDDAALGAAKAVEEAGSKAKVTGVDATSEAIAQIEAGPTFLATVELPFPKMMTTMIDAVKAYAKDGTMPSKRFIVLDTTLVTKANAAQITPSDKLG